MFHIQTPETLHKDISVNPSGM